MEKAEHKKKVKSRKTPKTKDTSLVTDQLYEEVTTELSPKKQKSKKAQKIQMNQSDYDEEMDVVKNCNQKRNNSKTASSMIQSDSENEKVSKTAKKNKNETKGDSEILGINPSTEESVEKIDWPQKDMSELIKRIEAAIPDKDSLAYGTRADKLNWDDIAFNEYSGDECKKIWSLIQKRVRRFRLLREVLQDAKDWISKPWTNFYRGNKTKRHPDMPKRPLSVYMIFYLKKKDKILYENPGMEMTEVSIKLAQMYKHISPAKREKYAQLAADERKHYEKKLEEFYRLHPEISRYADKHNHHKPAEIGPKKPLTPFNLYYEEQLKNIPSDLDGNRNSFKEQCKEQWKNMSDKKKVVWIDWALDNEAKYQDELKNYISQNPDFAPATVKPVLTKEEKSLKERLAGKPIKPPNSAYSLFSRMMLQSEDIKKIAPKDRMKAIADQWKDCTEKEKKQYRERAIHLMEQYKLDFASYLESLPEEKRQEELQNNLPKRKLKPGSANGDVPPSKKKKRSSSKIKDSAIAKLYESEPAQPPVSGFALFSKRYHGKAPVEIAWKNLNKLEKKEYEAEVQKLKQKYIKEYEKFLKGLSKEQLTAFSQSKQKGEGLVSDDNDEKSDDSSSESESENETSEDGLDE